MKNTIQKDITTTSEAELSTSPAKLFNRDYILLWQGQFVSKMGSQVYSIVIALWLKQITDSGSLVGLFFMLSALPVVLFGALGGAFADRFSRKQIIVLSDVVNGLLITTLGVLLFILPAKSPAVLISVFVVAILVSTVNAFFGPAISASIPDLVPKKMIAGANSMGQLSDKISVFFGQGFGVPLLSLLGMPVLVVANGITYLVSAFSESFIRIPQIIPEGVKSIGEYMRTFRADLREGVDYIFGNSGLTRLLLVSVVLNFFTMPVIVLLIFYVQDFLKVSANWYGPLLAIYGFGALAGYTLVGLIRVTGKLRQRLLPAFMIAESAGYVFLSQIHSPVLAAILFFAGGAMSGFIMINIMTLLQLSTPSKIRGRVFGTLSTISGSVAPIGMGLGGLIYDLANKDISLIYLSCGLIMIVLISILTADRNFKKYIGYELEDEWEETGFNYNVRYVKQEEIPSYKDLLDENKFKKPWSEL